MSKPAAPPPDANPSADPAAGLDAALRAVLAPLARLAVARGVPHAALEQLLKQALVDAADRSHAGLPPHRRVSRITTATGIHRREVTRLIQDLRQGTAQQAPAARSHASALFTRWRTDARYGDVRGSPAELPRQGPVPSFESLAQSITRDVHPRSLLDELLRLGLAAHDPALDTVRLLREGFVPQGDAAGMAAVLGRNVGSHLQAAVDNLLQDSHCHLEQAVFADGLSEASLAEFMLLAKAQWLALMDSLVPALERMVARDTTQSPSSLADAAPRHSVRIGLYTFSAVQDSAPEAAKPAAKPAAQPDTQTGAEPDANPDPQP